MNPDELYMQMALREAEKALEDGEIPIGAVVVCGDKIVAKAHNQVERLNDATAHAEMLALTAAMNHLQSKYLPECILYVTVEPCSMCSGAIHWAKLKKVVYGATDEKLGFEHLGCPLHPKTEIVRGVLEKEARKLMQTFFQSVRKK